MDRMAQGTEGLDSPITSAHMSATFPMFCASSQSKSSEIAFKASAKLTIVFGCE